MDKKVKGHKDKKPFPHIDANARAGEKPDNFIPVERIGSNFGHHHLGTKLYLS